MRRVIIIILLVLLLLAYSQEARTTVGRVSEDKRVISTGEQMKHAVETVVGIWRK